MIGEEKIENSNSRGIGGNVDFDVNFFVEVYVFLGL